MRAGLQQSDAADLVQDVLSLLLVKLAQFQYDPTKSFRSRLRAVTLNKWKENHRKADLLAKDDVQAIIDVEEPDNVADFWEKDYRNHLVRRVINLRKVEFQTVTWKAFWQCAALGRSAAEVAAELGISANAVYIAKSQRQNAICKLSPQRTTDHLELCGIVGEAIQPTREGNRKVLDRSGCRSPAATASGLLDTY